MNIEYIIDILYGPFRDFLTICDVLSLISVNSDLYNLFTNRGFAKNITYSCFNNFNEFVEKLNVHKDFLKRIKLYNIKNPLIWLPIIKQELVLHECHFLNANFIQNINFDRLRTLKLDKCYNLYNNIIEWSLLPNLINLDIQYIAHPISFENLSECKNLELFCMNAKHISLELHNFNGLNNLKYFITNCYIEPEQTLETPALKIFVGDVKNIIIKSLNLEYVNIGTSVSSDIIKYSNHIIHLFDITNEFNSINFNINSKRLNDRYHKYFTQIIY